MYIYTRIFKWIYTYVYKYIYKYLYIRPYEVRRAVSHYQAFLTFFLHLASQLFCYAQQCEPLRYESCVATFLQGATM